MLQRVERPSQNRSAFAPHENVGAEFHRAATYLGKRLVGFTNSEIKMLLLAAASPQCTRILLVGQHGTGKSTAARELSAPFN